MLSRVTFPAPTVLQQWRAKPQLSRLGGLQGLHCCTHRQRGHTSISSTYTAYKKSSSCSKHSSGRPSLVLEATSRGCFSSAQRQTAPAPGQFFVPRMESLWGLLGGRMRLCSHRSDECLTVQQSGECPRTDGDCDSEPPNGFKPQRPPVLVLHVVMPSPRRHGASFLPKTREVCPKH